MMDDGWWMKRGLMEKSETRRPRSESPGGRPPLKTEIRTGRTEAADRFREADFPHAASRIVLS